MSCSCSRRSRELLPVGLSERRWVLQDLHRSDAPHGLALVMIYAHKGANVRKNILKGVCELEGDNIAKTVLDINLRENILKGIRELEGVDIAKPVLDMCNNDKLCRVKDFST